MSELERDPACHPERSEGSLCPASQILRCAQDDMLYLQMSSHAASEFSLWPIMWYNEASENAAILPYFLFDKRIIC